MTFRILYAEDNVILQKMMGKFVGEIKECELVTVDHGKEAFLHAKCMTDSMKKPFKRNNIKVIFFLCTIATLFYS